MGNQRCSDTQERFLLQGYVSMEINELVYTFSWRALCLPSHTLNITKQKDTSKGMKPGRGSSKSSWETSAFKQLPV